MEAQYVLCQLVGYQRLLLKLAGSSDIDMKEENGNREKIREAGEKAGE